MMNSELKQENTKFPWVQVIKSIWYFLEEDRRKIVWFLIVLILVLFYSLIPAYVVGKIVDFFTSYSQGDSLKTFYSYTIFLGVSYVIVSIVRLYCKKNVTIMGQKARARVRILGFERLTEFSLEWHNKENTGNKLQRIFTGADAVKELTNLFSEKILGMIVNIFGILAIFLFVDTKLLLLIFCYFTVYGLVEFTISKKLLLLSNEFNKLNQSASGVYVESANNMLSIKALGGSDGINTRVTNKEELSRNISIEREKIFYSKWFLFQSINGIVLMLLLFITGKGVIDNTFTIGMILVFFTYFMKLRDVLGDFTDMHTKLIDLRSGLAQMMPIFTETEFIKTGNENFPKNWESIKMENVIMDYGSGQMGLDELNLEIPAHCKVGIAGLSGSGKSTLAKIMLGLYGIKSGSFKIGNENYYAISHNETLNNITVVLQETELFNLSLRDNITMMRPENMALLDKAIEISELGEIVRRLPEGLDAKIGEKGYMLSGGERQRLGIARAIYKNAPIIILDEATSSLDSETEGKIMEKLLGEYGKNKTFIIIAHRLGTLRYTDNIVVMERGKAMENGNYEELMNNTKSIFYRMNQEQKKEKKEPEE